MDRDQAGVLGRRVLRVEDERLLTVGGTYVDDMQVPELTRGRLRPWSARLFYAYADALLAAGRADEARDAFARAAQADPDGETDAADRLDQLDGIEFDDLEDDDLEDDDFDERHADEGHADEEDPTASYPG